MGGRKVQVFWVDTGYKCRKKEEMKQKPQQGGTIWVDFAKLYHEKEMSIGSKELYFR